MAEITELRADVMSPVLAGFIGAGVLVLLVLVLVLLWSLCQRRALRGARYKLQGGAYEDPAEDPPYRFIHMLKGISIYPESLSSHRIVRGVRGPRGARRADRQGVRRDAERGSRGVVPADVENNDIPGTPQTSRPGPTGPQGAPPDQADYAGGDSDGASPYTPSSASCDPEALPPRGTISLAVDYNFPKKALVVTVLGARGLPVMDRRAGSSDPYVKMTILPEKKHRVKTRVLRKTLEPRFDETFTFYGVAFSALPDLTLHFLVLSFDRYARDDVIGEALVPLQGVDPSTGRVHLSQTIGQRSTQGASRGQLLVSLSYQPVAHRLSVVVLKARDLPKMDVSGLSANPYVKVNVFYGRKRIAKKKTHVRKGTLDPVFNESFIYDVPPDLLPQVSVEFRVLDFDRTAKNQVLGAVMLGPHSPAASGAAHWQEVCHAPRRQISKWHSLSQY